MGRVGPRAPRRTTWALTATALVTPTLLVLSTGVSVAAPVHPASPLFVSYGGCGAQPGSPCIVLPATTAVQGQRYLVIAVVHGPGGPAGAVRDSNGDHFTNRSYCWNHNGWFGHTQVYVAWVLLKGSPSSYSVTAASDEYDRWMEVAVVSNYAGLDKVDTVINTCRGTHTTAGDETLTAPYTTAAKDLAVIAWAISANSTLTCSSGTSILAGPCGSSVSGTEYGGGTSWPALSYVPVTVAGATTATVSINGTSCASPPYCGWADAVVAVRA